MRRRELRNALTLGASRTAIVHRDAVSGCPGYVRTVAIVGAEGCAVRISFQSVAELASDEGGLHFRAIFDDLEASVACLEAYVGARFADWQGVRDPLEHTGHAQHDAFVTALREGRVPLPDAGAFRLESSEWYRTFLPFPSRY
jgi:hypothetical protein